MHALSDVLAWACVVGFFAFLLFLTWREDHPRSKPDPSVPIVDRYAKHRPRHDDPQDPGQ